MGEADNGLSKLPERNIKFKVKKIAKLLNCLCSQTRWPSKSCKCIWVPPPSSMLRNNLVTYLCRYSSCSTGFFVVEFVFCRVSKVCTCFEIYWIIDDLDAWTAYYVKRQQMLNGKEWNVIEIIEETNLSVILT